MWPRTVEADGYRFLFSNPLGEGAFARVFEVEELGFAGVDDLPLVAKIVMGSREDAAIREIGFHQQVGDAPHVLSLKRVMRLDNRFGPWDGSLAMILERGDTSLRDHCWRVGPMSEAQSLAVAADLAKGLASLHGHGLVHADLHAGNAIRTANGWKVGDLNATSPFNSSTGKASPGGPGSRVMFGPERRFDGQASVFDDMWSLGVLMLFMFRGHYPFGADGPISELSIHEALRGTPEQLAEIAGALLAWNPSVRTPARDISSRIDSLRLTATPEATPAPVTDQWWTLSLGSYRPGHLEVFGLGGGKVQHRWSLDNGSTWSGWFAFPFEDKILADICVCSLGIGHLEAFAVTADGAVLHSWLYANPASDSHDGWSTPRELWHPEQRSAVRIAAASIMEGHQEVFLVNADGDLWSRWYWASEGWSSWSRHEVPEMLESIAAASLMTGGHLLVALGRSGVQWAREWDVRRWSWTDWQQTAHAIPTPRGLATWTSAGSQSLNWADRSQLTLHGRLVGWAGDAVVTMIGEDLEFAQMPQPA